MHNANMYAHLQLLRACLCIINKLGDSKYLSDHIIIGRKDNHQTTTTDMDRPFWPFAICAVYLILIFGIKYLMKQRKAYDLKYPLAVWNLLLSLFSLVGTVRLIPHLLSVLYTEGFVYTVCEKPTTWYGSSASGLWTWIFIMSKAPELLDTLFVVLRKKPLIFLHW